MIDENDVRIDIGRASDNGDFLRLTHIPSGISRHHPGPLTGVNQHELIENWKREIESELNSHGPNQNCQ